jgi:disulfide bond formation protein DsbB
MRWPASIRLNFWHSWATKQGKSRASGNDAKIAYSGINQFIHALFGSTIMFIQSRWLLFLVGLASFGLIAFAVYLQINKNMLPCPWCVIQRYAFALIGFFALLGAAGSAPKPASLLGLLASLGGMGAAIHLIWVQAHPNVSCGLDPVETALNKTWTAEWFPTLFMANGECITPYPPVFGLTVPQGALVWFVLFTLVFILILARKRHV